MLASQRALFDIPRLGNYDDDPNLTEAATAYLKAAGGEG
jgi:hypothetical protein